MGGRLEAILAAVLGGLLLAGGVGVRAADAPGAIAVTPIFTGQMAERGGDFVSPDFTPPDNSLLVMVTFGVDDAYDVTRMKPVHNLAGEFTERVALGMAASSRVAAKVWTIPVAKGAPAAAGFAYPDGQSVKGRILMLFAVTGYDPAKPVGVSITSAAISEADGAVSLPAAPDRHSVMVAGRILDVDAKQSASATPADGWTELGDECVYERAGLEVQYRNGGGAQRVAWADINANKATNQQAGAFALEIRAAPAAK